MKTTVDLPDGLVKAVKLRAVHDGRKLKDTVAELLRAGLAHQAAGSATRVRADAAMMKRRRELVGKFVSGEWGVELAGYEASKRANRAAAKEAGASLAGLMAKLVDSSLWIDLTRTRSPRSLKRFVAAQLEDPEVCPAEPVAYEVLRHATDAEAQLLTAQFQTLPVLATPADVWSRGVDLGRTCRRNGITIGSLDLLIAVVALHHHAVIVTFDDDFDHIATVSPLQVKRLARPTA